MKIKSLAFLSGLALFSVLNASLMPSKPVRTLEPIDTVKAVVVYALGEWNNPQHTYHHNQNTPLPSYALNICDSARIGSIPDYYDEVSASKFIVNTQAWGRQSNTYSYVMQGFWTPMNADDQTMGPFVDSLVARIDRENEHSFAANAMYFPDNDNPSPVDTPFVWMFVLWPEVDGSWGLAPGVFGSWDVKTTETLNGDTVFVHVFGLSRQSSSHAGDAVAGIVHEFNHQWFPDIAYNPDHYGLGGFDPQAAGLGFYDDQGGLPSPLNPKWRCEAGWATSVNLGEASLYDRIIQDETKDTLYKFGDFYISVHRYQSYYESKWPGQGVLIWHPAHSGTTGFNYADESQWFGDFGYGYMDKPLDLEAAHGRWEWDGYTWTNPDPVAGRDNLDKRGYYTPARGFKGVGDSLCFFWPNYGTTQFDGLTNPSSRGHVFNAQGGVTGEGAPQEIALRRLQFYGNAAMKADFLYQYCIPSNYPGIAIHSGANNQRSLVPSISYTSGAGILHQLYAYAYVDNDPMLWLRISDGFLNLPNVSRQLVYQGDSASYPSLYSYRSDKSKLAICWLDGSSLYYREGYKVLEDTLRWNINTFDLSTLGDWPGFTAPSIVVGAGDTVFVAAGVSYTTFIPTGQGPGPTYLPILCFKFHKWHPEAAHVDTLALFAVDTIAGLGIGSSVALALDSYSRVHAVYVTNTTGNPDGSDQIIGHRYLAASSSEWSTELEVFPHEVGGGYYAVGSPCLEFEPDARRIYAVAPARHETKQHRDIYYSFIDVSGQTVPSQWLTPIQISGDTADATNPVIAGGRFVFWGESGELLYRDRTQPSVFNVSRTPHAWSSAPQAIYDAVNSSWYLVWRESNLLGSELDLFSLAAGGLPGGGQDAGKSPSVNPSLELALPSFVFAGDDVSIRYTLSSPVEDVNLKIYDCQGRLIYHWVITSRAGTIQWDGCDKEHRAVASGVYFIQLSSPEGHVSTKFTIVR